MPAQINLFEVPTAVLTAVFFALCAAPSVRLLLRTCTSTSVDNFLEALDRLMQNQMHLIWERPEANGAAVSTLGNPVSTYMR